MSEHIGTIGERVQFDALTVLRVRPWTGYYGPSTIVALQDERGNELTWFATGARDFQAGQVLRGTGIVKKHDWYRTKPQTTLTRCKFEVVEQVRVPAMIAEHFEPVGPERERQLARDLFAPPPERLVCTNNSLQPKRERDAIDAQVTAAREAIEASAPPVAPDWFAKMFGRVSDAAE